MAASAQAAAAVNEGGLLIPGKGSMLIPADEFIANFEAPAFVLSPIIPRGQVVGLTALPNAGKTTVAIPIALAATGLIDLPGFEADPCRVLYLVGENDANFRVQLIGAIEQYAVRPPDLHDRLLILPRRFDLLSMVDELRLMSRVHGGFGLIVVDTKIAYSGAGNEDDNIQASEDAAALRELTRAHGNPSVLVLCHPPKGADRDRLYPRGGGAFLGELDANLTLWNSVGGVATMDANKRRMPAFDPIDWTLDAVDTERTDAKGRRVCSVVARVISDGERADKQRADWQDGNRLVAVMADYPDATQADWARHCAWFGGNDQPRKDKVNRLLKRLAAGRKPLIELEEHSGRWVLTAAGKAEAKKP